MGSNGNLPFMPSRFEHRATFAASADDVFSTLVDEAFLTARLRDIGGKGAALLDHRTEGDTAAYRLRQGVDANKLPSAVKSILKGDLVVEREERWRGHESAGRATINGVPAHITSRGRLTGRGGDTELVISAEVKVGIPLVGGRLEKMVEEVLRRGLRREGRVGTSWLGQD